MGTTASIRFAGESPAQSVLDALEEGFAGFDARFSLYRADSELSRLARGELALPKASEVVRASYVEALHWRSVTHDTFTPHRPDGVIDLTGIVKAQAMAAAVLLLRANGTADWLLNVGGDVVINGSNSGEPWRLGIVDPDDRLHLLCAIALDPGRTALASSGTAERGEHVWRSRSESAYRQVTVVADDIITADVWATAILAGGPSTLDLAVDEHGVDVIAVDTGGRVTASERMRRADGFAAL
ncbi:hypothetical protein B7R54_19255 [Subtercola boreus]|uniref:FAD:protein FMN transferase n=2 Tax=Subtercola boreus TaxID=120213 RepID=A0A3E0V9Z1_9MICO|nr:hypothetical protein B7R54_19255 [Subtercola boreus]